MVQSCAVHDPHLAVFDTQVAKNIAFAMPVARLARQCQRRVVTLKSLLSLAQNGLYVTEQVVGVALNARIFKFARDGQRHLDARPGRCKSPFPNIDKGEAHKRTALASEVPDLSGCGV